jgi:hypothetical protein
MPDDESAIAVDGCAWARPPTRLEGYRDKASPGGEAPIGICRRQGSSRWAIERPRPTADAVGSDLLSHQTSPHDPFGSSYAAGGRRPRPQNPRDGRTTRHRLTSGVADDRTRRNCDRDASRTSPPSAQRDGPSHVSVQPERRHGNIMHPVRRLAARRYWKHDPPTCTARLSGGGRCDYDANPKLCLKPRAVLLPPRASVYDISLSARAGAPE